MSCAFCLCRAFFIGYAIYIFYIFNTHANTHTRTHKCTAYTRMASRNSATALQEMPRVCRTLLKCCCTAWLDLDWIGTSLRGSDCFRKLLLIQRSTAAPLAVTITMLRRIRTQRTMTGMHIGVQMSAGDAKF